MISFAETHGLEFSRQLYVDDLRCDQRIGTLRHGDSHIESACADSDHADASACRCMAVRSQQRLSRNAEIFDMELMADAVPRF